MSSTGVASLDRPGLGRLWDKVAERLQRNGLRPSGVLRLDELDRTERHAIAGLLGRPIVGDRVTVDLAGLDRRLRESGAASGLVAAADRLRGPLTDRPGRRQDRADAVAHVWATGRQALDDVGLGAASWVEPWLEELRRAGSLGRVRPERAERALATAVRCLGALPRHTDGVPCGRGELASLLTGDAHGLDDGSLVGAVVLRAAAAIAGTPYPSTPAGRRALWRTMGVITDEVSTTALTAGLRSTGESWLDERTRAGWESHLTARDLRRVDLGCAPGGVVHVCENPRVLEAALDAGCRRAVVCTLGQPTVVVTLLLEQLRSAGAELRYHGDFDWPGITIANLLVGTHQCFPWRFGATDYLDALARLAPVLSELPALGADPVTACWDEQLTSVMAAAGRAVHEEFLLDELLADLSPR